MAAHKERPGFIWMRLRMLWVLVRDSLWFIPSAFTLCASGLAVLLILEERQQWLPWRLSKSWLLVTGAEGAQQILSAIAGGLITVTGVVFSVTIVALQLASSQFTPRLLRNFTADRVNQVVLGVFIGTFTYALLVLGVIQHGGSQAAEFVPQLAVVMAVILLLVSIGFLIYFINHSAASIRVSVILNNVTHQVLRQIEKNYESSGRLPESTQASVPAWIEEQKKMVAATEAGYLMAIDQQALHWLGHDQGLRIRAECSVGEFVLPGQVLVSIVSESSLDEDTVMGIRKAFLLGQERTPEQDIEYGIIEIADIAIKALSPGINDPTTAMRCIDRLSQILLALAWAESPNEEAAVNKQVVFSSRHLQFDRAVSLAFKQVQFYGLENPTIMKKLLAALFLLIELVPPAQRPPLHKQVELLLEEGECVITTPSGKRELSQLAQEFQRLRQ